MTILQFTILITLFLLAAVSWWWLFVRNRNKAYPFSQSWRQILEEKVVFYRHLSKPEKARFEQAVMRFLDEVAITGVETTVEDVDRILVASSAVIPLFGFPGWRYRNINEVLLYQGTFNPDYGTNGKQDKTLGMVGSGGMNRMMILSQPALHQGFENQQGKENVGIHEFVHLLDKADGVTDGIPQILMQRQFVIPWLKNMHQEIEKIKEDKSDINPYGATSEVEFLTVVSEYFFNQPDQLERKHSELFALLSKMYNQDI